MPKEGQVQEQVTKNPNDKDPFTTKFKGNIASSGDRDRKEVDKEKLTKSVRESYILDALDKAIDKLARSKNP